MITRFGVAVFGGPLLVLGLLASSASSDEEPKPLVFEVSYTPEVHPGPITARVFVVLAKGLQPAKAPRLGLEWFHPTPFFAIDVQDWKPGEPLRLDGRAQGFPSSLDRLAAGPYTAQAVVRLNVDTHKLGDGEGNAYGPVVSGTWDAHSSGVVALKVDRLIPARPFPESERIKLVDIPSPLLSAFHHRPVRQRAAVLLPDGDLSAQRPALYIIPGFGGDHHMARLFARDARFGAGKDFVRVLLDPDCGFGHHVFADSAANGPRGRALIEELIPYVEAHFPIIAEPRARFVTGHSSGGWSSLWLQVTYAETFGGVWSTSPDPVDFRDFSGIDIYATGENMFKHRDGERRLIARRGPTPGLFLDDFSAMENVLGDGGQLRSFEAVFSPVDPQGRPRRLWDRTTGAIDPDIAQTWRAYDIRLHLERNWPTLSPKLRGKLHVYVGDRDTFFLEGAVRLLEASLDELGSAAQVEIVPGKDHSTLLDKDFAGRLDREMNAAWNDSARRP